jgi:hypothetical protein
MWSKCLKNVLAGLVIAGMSSWLISCPDAFNPFSNNLGEKVDVEPPTVVDITPTAGALLKGEVVFTGKATAYRDLKSVEVKIFNPANKNDPPLLDWTSVDKLGGTMKGDAKEKTWTFPLDTANEELYTYEDSSHRIRNGLADGFLRIQFRARDPNLTAATVELVYIIKNGPSVINMTMPSTGDLEDPDTGIPFTESKRNLEPNAEILGNIIDRRGIKPGFPRIKLWPKSLATTNPEKIDPATNEPFDNDTDWGWAVLFLSGEDSYPQVVRENDEYVYKEASYADRSAKPVLNVGNFSFRLSSYKIHPTTREIIYDKPANISGDTVDAAFVSLPSTDYYFKIQTKDTFFEEDINSGDYRKPKNPPDGETETEAFSPVNPSDMFIFTVKKTEASPNVDIDNEDIAPMPAEPHIYITQPTAKKIVLPVPVPNLDPKKEFRLRVKASNPDLIIARAELTWEHKATGRSGYLPWDNVYDEPLLNQPNYNEGYYKTGATTTLTEDQGEGHKGAWKDYYNQPLGKVFQFTAINGKEYPYKNSAGAEVTGAIFTGSTEPYTLIVTVWPTSSDNPTTQPYTLYLDGSGPEVSIYEIKGAFSGPETDPVPMTGGTVNTNSYSVNGNIQIAIDRSANMGIGQVKWAVEAAAVTEDGTEAGLYANTNSLYRKLRNFRDNPTAPDAMAFFTNLETAKPVGTSGLVTEIVDRKYSFKMNVRGWNGSVYPWPDGQDLWLYIIAQDGVSNLGYTVQKLHVDEGKDTPVLNIAGLAATTGDDAITSENSLYIDINNANEPTKVKANVLNRDQGIEVYLFDDDGMKASEVVIELTSHNINRTVPFNAVDMIGNNEVLREKNTILSQAIMAKWLYDDPATKDTDESPGYLPDGVYTIKITASDDWNEVTRTGSKISGAGLPWPVQESTGKTIHFVVYSDAPRIDLINPASENAMQTEGNVDVFGTVTSRLKIQKLDITFTPDILTRATGSRTEVLPLYTTGKAFLTDTTAYADAVAAGAWKTVTPNADGDYVYYWKRTVDFANVPVSYTLDGRFFNLRTWDGLGELGVAERNVQIDKTPPTIELIAFNFGRLDDKGDNIVNGKVPFDINAFDLNSIGPQRAPGYVPLDSHEVSIQWFVAPSSGSESAAPVWVTTPAGWIAANTGNRRGGQFTNGDNRSGGLYRASFDTSDMVDGEYKLYVIAEDTAGNQSPVTSLINPPFTIKQTSDDPEIREMAPENGLSNVLGGGAGELKLTGSIYDDDGFDPLKAGKFDPPALGTAKYVQIRFPRKLNNNDNDNYGGWNDTWEDVPVEIDPATGYLKYEFRLAGKTYFNSDGEKFYQLRVTDEAVRGATPPDVRGNYAPEGKNPDMYNGKGVLINPLPVGFHEIEARTVFLPSNNNTINQTNAYCFFLKNTDPVVYYNNYDPVQFKPDGTPRPGYQSTRPTFSTRAMLAAALTGTIEEISLRQPVVFTYGNSNEEHDLYTVDKAPQGVTPRLVEAGMNGNAQIYTWALDPAWLAGFDSTSDGMNSVTIRATDTIGNYTIAEWSFSKDTKGPDISFDNISTGSVTTISGNEGDAIAVSGQFNDELSIIGYAPNYETVKTPSFEFKLYRANETAPPWTQVAIATNGSVTGQSAVWKVPIPGTYEHATQYDGPYRFQIRVKDVLGITRTIGSSFTAASPAGNTNSEIQANTRYFTLANHGLAVGDTVIVSANNVETHRYVLWVGGTNDSNFKLSNNYTMSNPATNVWNPGQGNITTTGIQFIVDRKEPQMISKADDTATANRIVVKGTGLVAGSNGILAESRRVFSAANILLSNGNLDTSKANSNAVVFTLRGLVYEHNLNELNAAIRSRSQSTAAVSPALTGLNAWAGAWKNGGTVTTWYGNGTGTNNLTDANLRIRRAATFTATTTAASTNNTNPVGGNANTRYYTFANHGLAVGDRVVVSVGGIETNRYVLWVGGTNDSNFKLSDSDTWPTSTVYSPTANTSITVSEAATITNRYVWELDIRERDFYALKNQAGMSSDDITRVIAITARDMARKDSVVENWQFKLDSAAPAITFSNVVQHTGTAPTYTAITTLEDTNITLSGTAEDTTNISRIEYAIQRYNYATSAWEKFNSSNAWVTGTLATADWRTYTVNGNNSLESWSITNAAANSAFTSDGLYRFSIRAADFSLSNNAGGNLSADNANVSEFFIDRSEPVITWNPAPGTFYRWSTANTIVFNLSVADLNTLKTTVVNTPTADLRGELRRFDTNEVVSRPTATTGYVTVAMSATNANTANSTVTVTINRNNVTLANRRYILTLTIKDKAGHQASVNQTINFYLDNTPPSIGITPNNATPSNNPNPITSPDTPNVINEAITGRVAFQASFTKTNPDSPVKRVAYKVDRNATAAVPTDLSDTGLLAANWRFNNGEKDSSGHPTVNNPYKLTTNNSIDLMEINEGLSVANILIYDTRNFVGTAYVGSPTAATNQTFNGSNVSALGTLYGSTDIHDFKLHLLAIDEAGNTRTQTYTYSIYPAGDYPRIVTITNPNPAATTVERQLNGTIRISGTATDNYRVQGVWFRVLKDGYNNAQGNPIQHSDTTVTIGYEPVTNLKIPVWDSFWNATSTNQTPTTFPRPTVTESNHGSGWFKANGGGPGSISWWAQINTDGELDPGLSTSRGIIIQTMAEDTIWVDSENNGAGGYAPTGILSVQMPVAAWVVKGAPVFAEEQVRTTGSASYGNILTSAVKGNNASYQVVVRHDSGVGEIRWTNGPAGVSGTDNILSDNGATIHGSLTTNGIEATAGPRTPVTSGALEAGATYMVWLPAASRYTTFVAAAGDTASGTLIKQVNGSYEWLVTVTLNTEALTNNCTCTNPTVTHANGGVLHTSGGGGGGSYAGKADYYFVNLEAYEISKSVPLFSRRTAQIPIDNLPPSGIYNHSTSVAGTAPTFGGEAGDAAAPVTGLSRVVMWFSQNNTSIPWAVKERNASGDYVPMSPVPTFSGSGTAPDGVTLPGGGTVTLPTGVTWPVIPAENAAEDQFTCVVIDRTDQVGGVTHHGHKLAMGLQTTGGGLGTSWYASLDSWRFESGRVTAHYIVYDRAGNATYYSQRLIILNGIPRISTITLATDIGTGSLHTTAGLGALAAGNNNKKNNETNVNTDGAMARIRTVMGLTTDVARGISEEIPIDTSRPGVYSVVYDRPDFLVRNNLFAIKVNTDVKQNNKTRNYRVEYVSDARNISGAALITMSTTASQSGIRAGKVYIINNVGFTTPTGTQQRFPWGVLGVQGETYQRGTVFIATVNGDEIGLSTANFANIYGTPSVWELNGTYYTGNATTTVLDRAVPGALEFSGGSDVTYTAGVGETGKTAEFVYRASSNGNGAFGTTAGSTIVDFNAGTNGANLDAVGRPKPYSDLAAATTAPWTDVSLFIIKIFDGPETDVFGDFALLSIRVNNNDKTPPYAQLYDMNPKTEGESANYTTAALAQTAALESTMGATRTKGGLWNTTGSASNVAKSGHVEPRAGTSLTSAQMGGGSGTINRPAASSSSGVYFTVDTVSGDVIIRGYAEDNQRIARVDLEIWNENNNARLPNNTGANSSITILTQATKNYTNALQATDANRIKFTDTIDLNRHRVEWSYVWSTETTPSAYMVGNINVRVRAYNTNDTLRNIANNTAITTDDNGYTSASKRIQRSAITTATRTTYDSFNTPDFPASTGNFYRYNDIRVNIRPYITGFKRNQNLSAHDIRSRQGRRIFYRNEVAVVTGFNLGNDSATNSTTITLPTATATVNADALRVAEAAVGTNDNTTGQNQVAAANQLSAFGLSTNNRSRSRIFVVPDTAASGNGLVRLTYTSGGTAYQAVNTGTERPQANNRPTAVQPWNIEYNPGREGSELWDDFTQVHIWRSDNAEGTTANSDYSRFPASANWVLLNPAMSVDPSTGTLYESHGEGGSGFNIIDDNQGAYNSGTVKLVNNNTTTFTNSYGSIDSVTVAQFRDPIIMTDVYRSPGGTGAATAGTWTTYSIIGRSGQYQGTGMLGGIYIRGPGGTTMNFNGGFTAVNNFIYSAESTWYNASTQSSTVVEPPTTDQFENPHIVTYASGANEHIHVSYYDAKDGSVKYRYNQRGSPSLFAKSWVNLDGGFDANDWQAQEAAGNATYTLTQANGIQIPISNNPAGYNYLRETFVTNNTYVEAGQPIYTMGAQARNTVTYLYEICAPHAGTITNVQQPTATGNFARLSTNYSDATGGRAFTITWTASAQSTTRVVNYSTRNGAANPNVGQHNAIAVTSAGYPVIAYFDMTNQRLKLAISNNVAPTAATNWAIRDNVIPSGNLSAFGTGPYVSMKIDTRVTPNRVHIAALNSVTKQLVYVTGTLAYSNANPPVATFTNTTADVQVVDSVGDVGRWCSLSLDADGNPWISYQDEGYKGAKDGVKVAYKNTTTFTKGGTGTTYAGQDTDINGANITGWEAMHVPTQFRVEDSRLGMECYPPRNYTGTTATKTWGGAVSYLATDYYRIAYYVK